MGILQDHEAELGRPQAKWTKVHWRELALALVTRIDPKPVGRPRIQNELMLLLRKKAKARIGRPSGKYCGLSAVEIDQVVEKLGRHEVKKDWPDAPRSRRDRLGMVLFVLQEEVGGYHDVRAVERAIRRAKADKKKKEI